MKVINGLNCIKKQVDKKVCTVPLAPQPGPESVTIIHSYYATLKSESKNKVPPFKKRVTWIAEGKQIALVEYTGTPPQCRLPHALSQRNATGFVHTPPEVIENLRMAVGKNGQGQAPKEAYTNAILQDISDLFNSLTAK